MRFGRSCRPAAAVPAGLAAEKNNNVSRRGLCAVNHIGFRSADDEAGFETLSLITGVVQFFHLTGSKPYLIPVRRKARRRRFGNNPLRQFSFQSIFNRFGRIRAARYSH